jgi:outer membrane immunogenic protein
MKKILLSSVALFGIAGTALAADLPARMPVKAPPIMAPAFSWTGCYIGGYVGGAFAGRRNGDTDVVVQSPYSTTRGFYNAPSANVVNAGLYGYDLDSSIIGGGTLGCNWQPLGSQFVLGIEGEGGYLNLKGSAIDRYSIPLYGSDTTSTTHIGDWYAAITGRVGFAIDRVLIYGKGGVGFTSVEASVVDGCVTAPCGAATLNAQFSDTRAFWVGGGGIEWAFDMNWSVKAEYLFLGLKEDLPVCGVAGGSLAGVNFCSSHSFDGIHTAKIGVNYRFGAGPVVARY